MTNTFKIGTFNCHNLFSRSKVLNRVDKPGAEKLLTKVGLLRQELEKAVFNQQTIIKLYEEINTDPDTKKPEDFIEIIDMRNKLFGKRKNTNQLFVKPKGKNEWDGFISFKKSKFTDEARLNTVKVIHEMNADILSLIEVEDKPTLDAFNSQLIGKDGYKKYPFTILIDGFDRRGIDVALLSRYPFEDIRTHMYDVPKTGGEPIFSRDCLEVKIKLPNNGFIYMYVNHFKSQGYGTPQQNDARRLPQAQRVAEIILKDRKLNLQQDKVVVLGDFNADRGNQSLDPLLKLNGIKDILELKNITQRDRWTYYYEQSKNKKTWQQLDYILVSEPLQKNIQTAVIERRGIYDLDKISFIGEKAWDSVQKKGPWAQASDHAGICAEFKL